MTPLCQQMIAALQLSGKGERTQQAFVREVRLLADTTTRFFPSKVAGLALRLKHDVQQEQVSFAGVLPVAVSQSLPSPPLRSGARAGRDM